MNTKTKTIITFGSSHLEDFNVISQDVMLVIEAESHMEAREFVMNSEIGAKWATSYDYERNAERLKTTYGMIEYTWDELMARKKHIRSPRHEIWQITEDYWAGIISYYDALEAIIAKRCDGANIVSIDDGIKSLQKHYTETKEGK